MMLQSCAWYMLLVEPLVQRRLHAGLEIPHTARVLLVRRWPMVATA
jgi:hypothetical protein